jgi:hypothetical protein
MNSDQSAVERFTTQARETDPFRASVGRPKLGHSQARRITQQSRDGNNSP